jgi:hypothetical protein
VILPIEVIASYVSTIVANYNAIRIAHRYNFENAALSQLASL